MTDAVDLQQVRQKLQKIAAEGRIEEVIDIVIDLLEKVRKENTSLQQRLAGALRQLYGRKSEKTPAAQLALMFATLGDDVPQGAAAIVKDAQSDDDEQQPLPPAMDDEIQTGDGSVPKPPKKPRPAGHRGGKRTGLPHSLPRYRRRLSIREDLRVCSQCGKDKTPLPPIRSEILEFVPAHFIVIEEEREKLLCKTCGEFTTAASTKTLDRGRPGANLLAQIVVGKGQDALPLYRQSQIYQRGEVRISDSTLGDWFAFAALVLTPIYNRIKEWVLDAPIIGADDTPMPVQEKASPKRRTKRGHLWAYVGYREDGNLVVFEYSPDWRADWPRAFLQDFSRYLQCDGYRGFKKVLGPGTASRLLGCGMHIRRRFEAAKDLGDARAAIALAYFRRLYDIERRCKADKLTPAERGQVRAQESVPVVDELYAWINEVRQTLIPGDSLASAIQYAINQEQFFRRCFEDGRFEIDNGEVERRIRAPAIGRKNYLFAGSDAAAQRLAIVYTILGCCHMHGVNPANFVADVLDKIQNGWPQSRIDELLPHRWVPRGPEEFMASLTPLQP